MANIRVTITDSTKRFNLNDLFRAPAGNSYAGATIVNFNKQALTLVQYATIQHDPTSLANNLYVGDKNVSSSNYGLDVLRGNVEPLFPTAGNTIRLADIWIAADANGAVFQVMTQEL